MMPETPEDDALIEAMTDAAFGFVDQDNLKAAARVLGLVRAHDAPTLATLTASLAEAEARAGRAEATVERLREALGFYANPEVYRPHPHGPAFDRRDISYRALAALQETPHGR